MSVKVLEELNLPLAAQEEWSYNWDLSQACYPEDGPFFLKERFLEDVAYTGGLRKEAQPAFFASGAQIRSSEQLSRLAWHCHWLAHVAPPELRGKASPWSSAAGEARIPAGNTFFMAIVAMSALPRIRAFYHEHGIPESILRASALALDIWAENFFEKHGVWGCDHAPWICQHTVPTLFRLERLEFQFGEYKSPFKVFRCKTTGKVAIMAPEGLGATADGFFTQKGEEPAFTTTLEMNETEAKGFIATDDGHLAGAPVALPLVEWEQIFHEGDKMINIHIPACAPLDYEACKAGIKMARDFFPRYFPAFDFKGFQCGSWLLDISLKDSLPPTANIPQFQTLFNLYPAVNGNDWQIRERVFGNPDLPIEQVPQKTSLQRIVKQRIMDGHKYRSGACFLPR